jgi:uncharacterized membrane protein
MRTLPAAGLPAGAVLWLVALLLAPLAVGRPSIGGSIERSMAAALYQSASLLCHQKAERSFYLAGAPMPVCARCLGLYAAGAVGAIAAFAARGRTSVSPAAGRAAIAAASAPILLSVGLEWLGAISGSNAARLASAVPLGLAAGWLVEHTVLEEAGRVADRPEAVKF